MFFQIWCQIILSSLLSPVSCHPSPVSCIFLLSSVSCLLSPVFSFLSSVSRLLSPISDLPSPVSCLCLLSPVSYLPSTVSCRVAHISFEHSLLLSSLALFNLDFHAKFGSEMARTTATAPFCLPLPYSYSNMHQTFSSNQWRRGAKSAACAHCPALQFNIFKR